MEERKVKTAKENKIHLPINQPMVNINLEIKNNHTNNNIELSYKELLTLIGKGSFKLFVEKSSNILNPISFIINNYKEVGLALLHLLIPGVITYYCINNPIISSQLLQESFIMNMIYPIIFYIGSSFLWVSVQVLIIGIFNMFKNSLNMLAAIGKE